MTQPQYGYGPPQGYQPDPYAQQYPGQPQYAPQGPPLTYQQPPAPQYGAQQGFPPHPGYGQQYGPQQPQQPPVPQGAKGTLDDFYGQPSTGGGKGISWKQKPDMYRYVGVVSKTPQDGDVFQDSDPQTKALKTWRDGSPKLVMPVQLHIAWLDQWQQLTYPDTEASVYLRGNMKEEVTRAMAEAGVAGVPQQGALMDITLTHRKPGNNIASNVYAVVYRPAGIWENDPAYAWVAQFLAQQQLNPGTASANPNPVQIQQQAPVTYGGAPQGPYQQQASAQYAAPAQANPNPQQYAQPGAQSYGAPAGQPQYGGQAYDPNQQAPAPAQYAQAPAMGQAAGVQPQPQAYPQTPQDQGTPQGQQYPAQQVNPSQGQAPGGYAPQQGQIPGQQQLPIPGVNGPTPQPGVTPSQLNPGQQGLLAKITAGQIQPQQGPQG